MMKKVWQRTFSALLTLAMLLSLLIVPAGATEAAGPSSDKRIHVYDIAGKQETNTDLYVNHITPAAWVSKNVLTAAGSMPTGGTLVTFDDFALHSSKDADILVSTVESADWGTITTKKTCPAGNYNVTFADGYQSQGAFVNTGNGTADKRYVTIKAKAGETVNAYVGNYQKDTTYGVVGLDDVSLLVKSKEVGILSFVAPKEGTYKIYDSLANGKPAFMRVTVTPPVTVSGTVALPATGFDATGWGVSFVNSATQTVTKATVTGNTYTAELAPGTYTAALTGAPGWGVKGTVSNVTVDKAKLLTGQTHALEIVERPQYTYSGTITGFAADYDLADLAVTMTADTTKSPGSLDVPLTLVKTDPTAVTFTALLDAGVEYAVSLAGADDYAVKTPAAPVTSAGDDLTNQSIAVEAKALQNVSGKFVVLDPDDQFAPLYADSTYKALPEGKLTALKFAYVEVPMADPSKETASAKYVYEAALTNDGGYTASLRPGAYKAVATVDGYTTTTHVVVKDATVEKNLLFVAAPSSEKVAYAADVYVGYAGDETKTPNFKTVTGALAYIKDMTRTDAQRVTVHIAPGTYREQINVDVKNVTFVNDTNQSVTLTWYYGIGYKYYSALWTAGTESWYDAQRAFDRYMKEDKDVSRWGATVRVRAPGFQAQGITFENSFNRYMTDEEIADGVALRTGSSAKLERTPGVDVTAKAYVERAAAIWVDNNDDRGDMTEFKDCKFLSSQDTVGTGERMYFKDCYIEGMTDYICGPGDVVFDTCTLNWKGYSDVAPVGGYLTAPQTTSDEKGYLFRNCYVSSDSKFTTKGAGAMGRTWGGSYTGCVFYNTTLQSAAVITEPTWIDMNGFHASEATKIHEWGTKLLDGTAVDLTKRQLDNTVLAAAPTINVKTDYFKDWTPEYYTEEATGVALAAAPTVSDNGDINLPRPGHTLTVEYTLTPEENNANDVSAIQWYRVKAGAETLVKTSAANADKTYKITAEDVGCQIKVTVTPKTMGGQTGEAMSGTVAETVKEGYDDPSGITDPVLGDGVNVYLAGDSTVMDYSATGMHNSGKARTEGSWGEWLQTFFNDKVTVVNYAKGGRTTRQFMEDDHFLDKIDATMKEGDFLCIQFGHNDCYTADSRYVPLGIANGAAQKTYAEGGVYPDTTADGKTTYTGYLKKYIEVTEKHDATAVLMTPVARMYYTGEGKIRPHHDASTDGTNDNEYCKAVKWVYDWAVAQGYKVAFQDNYQLTADLYEKAYADCTETAKDTYGKQLMQNATEGTHNGKLGGLIEAAIVAQAIQNSDLTIAKAVKDPDAVQGVTPEGKTAFTITADGAFSAFDHLTDFASRATYWEGEGKALFDAIAAKAEELNGGSDTPDTPDEPVAVTKITVTAPAAEVAVGATLQLTAAVEPANATEKGVTWTSGDETVATVDANGVVTGKAAGKVTITAASKETGSTVTGSVELTVVDPAEALAAAIKAAQAELDGTEVSSDGTDVSKNDVWTSQDAHDTLAAAIKAATDAAKKEGVTNDELIEATKTLNAAVKTFVDAQADGTKPNRRPSPVLTQVTKPDTTRTENSTNDKGDVATTVTKPGGDKEITVVNAEGETVAEITLPATIPAPKTKFKDVPEGHWAEKAIDNMAALGMVKGVNEAQDEFDMNSTMTRASIATMFFRLSNGKEGVASTFADVAEGQWYSDAIGWAAKTGVVNGYSETAFGPDDTITRQQLAVMLTRYANLIGMDTKAHASALDPFADGDKADDWAVDGLAWCVKNGIMKGRGGDVLDPTATVSRAETAAMFDRVIELFQK